MKGKKQIVLIITSPHAHGGKHAVSHLYPKSERDAAAWIRAAKRQGYFVRRELKENPSIDATIYGRVLAIEAEKTGKHVCDAECKKFKHRYRHDFKSGPVMYGLSDGSILIKAR